MRLRFAVFVCLLASSSCSVSTDVFPQEPGPELADEMRQRMRRGRTPEHNHHKRYRKCSSLWPTSRKWRCTITARFLR